MDRISRPLARLRLVMPSRYLPLAATVAMPLALVVGLLGQRALDRRPVTVSAWALLLVGAAVFGLAARRQALERPPEACPGAAETLRPVPLVLSLVLAVLAFPGFAGNRFRLWPTLAWLTALGLLYASFRSSAKAPPEVEAAAEGEGVGRATPAGGGRRPWLPVQGIQLSWHNLALLGILAVGAVLRLRQLDAIPAEMGVDLPLKYQNAREILQGQFMIFCPRYPGREALYHYLLAAYGAIFGLSHFGIKLVSVLVGLASILALYALARYLYDREAGLLVAGFLAVSKWHVILSRSGYRAVMMPLMVALVMLAAARALDRQRGRDYVVAGMVLGLGLYTYNAFLIAAPTLAVAVAVGLMLRRRGAPAPNGWGLVTLALAALMVFAPLGRYALESPGSYLFRVATRVTGMEVPLPADLVRVFARNLWNAAGMFNVRGDSVFYINVPHQRELGIVSGALFIFGLAYTLVRWRRGHNALVLVFLAGLTLPTALAVAFPHEVPNAVRASGALTPAYLLVALPLVLLRRSLTGALQPIQGQPLEAYLSLSPHLHWHWRGRVSPNVALAVPVCIAILLGVEGRETWRAYFQDYVRNLPGRNYPISLELARVLDEFAPEGPAYVKVWPHWYDGNALRAQLRVKEPTWDWELPELSPDKPPLSTVQGRVLFIVHPEDQATLEMLRAVFPRGIAIDHRDNAGRVAFVTFYGER